MVIGHYPDFLHSAHHDPNFDIRGEWRGEAKHRISLQIILRTPLDYHMRTPISDPIKINNNIWLNTQKSLSK